MNKEIENQIHSIVNEAASFAAEDKTKTAIVILATETGGMNGAGMIGGCIGGTTNNLAASIATMMKSNDHFAEAIEAAYLHHKFNRR